MVLNGPGYRPKYRGPSNGLSWTIEGKKKEMPDKLTVTFLPIYRVLSFFISGIFTAYDGLQSRQESEGLQW